MTRGLGARYGSTVRKRYIKVLSETRKDHKCPQCGSASIRRESVGVWNCRKCGLTFTGGAYTPVTCGLTFTGGAYTPVTKLGVVAKRAVKSLSAPEG